MENGPANSEGIVEKSPVPTILQQKALDPRESVIVLINEFLEKNQFNSTAISFRDECERLGFPKTVVRVRSAPVATSKVTLSEREAISPVSTPVTTVRDVSFDTLNNNETLDQNNEESQDKNNTDAESFSSCHCKQEISDIITDPNNKNNVKVFYLLSIPPKVLPVTESTNTPQSTVTEDSQVGQSLLDNSDVKSKSNSATSENSGVNQKATNTSYSEKSEEQQVGDSLLDNTQSDRNSDAINNENLPVNQEKLEQLDNNLSENTEVERNSLKSCECLKKSNKEVSNDRESDEEQKDDSLKSSETENNNFDKTGDETYATDNKSLDEQKGESIESSDTNASFKTSFFFPTDQKSEDEVSITEDNLRTPNEDTLTNQKATNTPYPDKSEEEQVGDSLLENIGSPHPKEIEGQIDDNLLESSEIDNSLKTTNSNKSTNTSFMQLTKESQVGNSLFEITDNNYRYIRQSSEKQIPEKNPMTRTSSSPIVRSFIVLNVENGVDNVPEPKESSIRPKSIDKESIKSHDIVKPIVTNVNKDTDSVRNDLLPIEDNKSFCKKHCCNCEIDDNNDVLDIPAHIPDDRISKISYYIPPKIQPASPCNRLCCKCTSPEIIDTHIETDDIDETNYVKADVPSSAASFYEANSKYKSYSFASHYIPPVPPPSLAAMTYDFPNNQDYPQAQSQSRDVYPIVEENHLNNEDQENTEFEDDMDHMDSDLNDNEIVMKKVQSKELTTVETTITEPSDDNILVKKLVTSEKKVTKSEVWYSDGTYYSNVNEEVSEPQEKEDIAKGGEESRTPSMSSKVTKEKQISQQMVIQKRGSNRSSSSAHRDYSQSSNSKKVASGKKSTSNTRKEKLQHQNSIQATHPEILLNNDDIGPNPFGEKCENCGQPQIEELSDAETVLLELSSLNKSNLDVEATDNNQDVPKSQIDELETNYKMLKKRFSRLQLDHSKLMGIAAELTGALQRTVVGGQVDFRTLLDNCNRIYPELFVNQKKNSSICSCRMSKGPCQVIIANNNNNNSNNNSNGSSNSNGTASTGSTFTVTSARDMFINTPDTPSSKKYNDPKTRARSFSVKTVDSVNIMKDKRSQSIREPIFYPIKNQNKSTKTKSSNNKTNSKSEKRPKSPSPEFSENIYITPKTKTDKHTTEKKRDFVKQLEIPPYRLKEKTKRQGSEIETDITFNDKNHRKESIVAKITITKDVSSDNDYSSNNNSKDPSPNTSCENNNDEYTKNKNEVNSNEESASNVSNGNDGVNYAEKLTKNDYSDLNYQSIRYDLLNATIPLKSRVLEALLHRITRSDDETRDIVMKSYITNDLLGVKEGKDDEEGNKYSFFKQLYLPDKLPNSHKIQQATARLVNAFASLRLGRDYLSESGGDLLKYILIPATHKHTLDDLTRDMLIATLQKLSLRFDQRMAMIHEGLVEHLITFLAQNCEKISPYCLEYSCALLMNLVLHREARTRLEPCAREAMTLIRSLLNPEFEQYLPYINGAIYSMLSNKVLRHEAKKVDLAKVMEQHSKNVGGEMRAQLEYMSRSLRLPKYPEPDCDCAPDAPSDEADLLEMELIAGTSYSSDGEGLLKERYGFRTRNMSSNNTRNVTEPITVYQSEVNDNGPSNFYKAPQLQKSDTLDTEESFCETTKRFYKKPSARGIFDKRKKKTLSDILKYGTNPTSRFVPPSSIVLDERIVEGYRKRWQKSNTSIDSINRGSFIQNDIKSNTKCFDNSTIDDYYLGRTNSHLSNQDNKLVCQNETNPECFCQYRNNNQSCQQTLFPPLSQCQCNRNYFYTSVHAPITPTFIVCTASSRNSSPENSKFLPKIRNKSSDHKQNIHSSRSNTKSPNNREKFYFGPKSRQTSLSPHIEEKQNAAKERFCSPKYGTRIYENSSRMNSLSPDLGRRSRTSGDFHTQSRTRNSSLERSSAVLKTNNVDTREQYNTADEDDSFLTNNTDVHPVMSKDSLTTSEKSDARDSGYDINNQEYSSGTSYELAFKSRPKLPRTPP